MKKHPVPIIIFLALITFTLISILIPKPLTSGALETVTTESEGMTRTDYVDESGAVTFAGDAGYATVIRYLEDGRVVKEEYLDPSGAPVRIWAGYDSLRRTYYEDGSADTDTYYIGDRQIERTDGFWGYKRIYEDGQVSELHYLDKDGHLTTNTSGFAMIRRSYFDGGYTEMYFDTEKKPTTALIGQYGVRIEGGTTTYLDINGKPANTSKGYAVVKSENGRTLYYDVDGDPATIGRSQYGTEIIDGRQVYLDENGEPMFRLDNFLNTNPAVVLIAGTALTLLTLRLRGKGRLIFLIVYLLFIGFMTIAYRETGDPAGQLIPFASYSRFFMYAETRQNILNNIWLFVPLGAILYSPGHKHRWLWCLALSVFIEILQYFTGIGFGEVDDIISNTLGGLTGFYFATTLFRPPCLASYKA